MTLAIRGATVVTSLAAPAVEPRDVLIADGRIVALESPAAPVADVPTLDASGCILIPGLVCAHTHAYSALARGMPYPLAPPSTFVETLRRIWWRLDRALDGPLVKASARVAAAEALLAGTTTLIDHHASPNAIDGSLDGVADAFAEVGIRGVLAYEVTDRDGPERAAAGVDENDRFAQAVADGAWPFARAMVGAHASFTMSTATLEACVSAARRHAVGLHIHLAEDGADERDAETRYGVRAAVRLAAAGAVTEQAILAHAVHLDPAEIELVRDAASTVVNNPRSNLDNRVGRSPVERLGERVALGTDGIGGDLFEESRVGWLVHRAAGAPIGGSWPLDRLAAGADVAGRCFGEPALGRIEPGAPADLVVLDYRPPTPLDAATWSGHWRYGLSAASVRDVVVGGRLAVRERRLRLVDPDRLAAEARAEAARLWRRLESTDEHPFDPEGHR